MVMLLPHTHVLNNVTYRYVNIIFYLLRYIFYILLLHYILPITYFLPIIKKRVLCSLTCSQLVTETQKYIGEAYYGTSDHIICV
jgi:hypothetical protein